MPDHPSLARAVSDLAPTFRGDLLLPGSAHYDAARQVHNGLINKRPALVTRCRGTSDVVDAIRLARAHGLEIAVRGGGHNVAGRGTVEGGLLIDLSGMRGIVVESRAKIARAQGGATWAGFNRETQVHGLATTGGIVSSTGIGGLTLGGGLGWTMGRLGLALDNLIGVEVVSADGSVLFADADEHPDLFWALRGGGGNFGVATTLCYRLHEIGPIVTAGLVAHPLPRAAETLRHYREVTEGAGDDLTVFAALVTNPDGNRAAALAACHAGSVADGERQVAPIKAFGPPVMDALGPMPYCALNGMLDASYPRGAFNYWKSSFLSALTDEAIDAVVECFHRAPTPACQIVIEHVHGVAARIPQDATAFPHRRVGYNLLLLAQWTVRADGDAAMAWAHESFAAIQPYLAAGRYVNYLSDEGADAVAAAYGANLPRLQLIKARYDPDNVFHLNQNIAPAARAGV
jgi:FAD/FMN-containing dehydrogenase